jgi:glutathione transport system ATP-binding protein
MQQSQRVLDVSHLNVRFATSERTVEAVRDLSFHVDRARPWPSSANRARASRCRRWR